MNVVGYGRLSRDEDKENYSSIESQISILKDYAKDNDLTISKIYIDDNCSGYTFDRPQFNLLKEDLENGKIDMILCKDFSRVGRRQGQAMVFVDSVKDCGSRLILVSDDYDSEKEDSLLGIKAWFNEQYIRDVSKKIRASMVTKQKNGELIMGSYYGYTKTKIESKYYLTIDEDIKPIIEMIFKCYTDGLGYKKICDILDKNNFPTPSEYKRQQHETRGRVFKNKITTSWQTHMIARIIHDTIYEGTLTTKKRHAKQIKGKQSKVPIEDQYTFPNHHEAIISQEDFELVQNISSRKTKTNFRGTANYDYIFSGFVECFDCHYVGIGLNLFKKPKIKRGYNCTTYHNYGKSRCSTHAISEEDLLIYLKAHLEDMLKFYEEMLLNINVKEKKKDISVNIDKFKKELNNANAELKLILSQKIKDMMKETNSEYRQIIEDTYEIMEQEKKSKISELNQRIIKLDAITLNNIEVKITTGVDVIKKILASPRPEKKLLEIAIDRIYLMKDGTPKIKVNSELFILYTN